MIEMAKSRPKIAIVGAGMVGSQAAFWAMRDQLGDIVLLDIAEGMAKGKALDLLQATPIAESNVNIVGGSDYALAKDADLVLITAGMPRKPGMTREELLEINAKIMKDIMTKALAVAPKATYLIMTNPLDAMTYLALKLSKLPREKVIGQAGVLDSARFRAFLAQECKVPVTDTKALVMGSHGEAMVPLPQHTTVKGKPISELLAKEKIDALVKRVQNAGAEIVELLQKGSAFYAPGAAIIAMAKSILKDEKRIMPCSVLLQGEYGIKNTCIGVPIALGKGGMEKIQEIELSDGEKTALAKAAEHIGQMQRQIDDWLKKNG